MEKLMVLPFQLVCLSWIFSTVYSASRTLYLDSFHTCNQLDYVVDQYQQYYVTTERKPSVTSKAYVKCHMTFKARDFTHRVCFIVLQYEPDPKCNILLQFYEGDHIENGVGAKFDCESNYRIPYKWCSGGQLAMIVLERTSASSSTRDMQTHIIVTQELNTNRTAYLDAQCGTLHLMDHSTVNLYNRHPNNSNVVPKRCEQIFEYVGEEEYPVCVTMKFNKNKLPDNKCSFLIKIGDGKSSKGSVISDNWSCDKLTPKEICSKGRILTVYIERLNYDSEQDPVGIFTLTVQDRSPAPPAPVSVTAIVLGVLGGIVALVLIYLILAVFLEQKKGIYIGPCCICRKYCKKYSADDSISMATGFTSVSTHQPGESQSV
ncbi:hypothetical protein LOTGIDRAFT_168999 [Lottia gigantea]|uniref:CUB domain-containing protein n=1 Tax=Lottia gigantea TaxID=225164 RepID=V3ZS87_LOTGI|nr:hypothetical protein LOTGIDRAFT_168999 [Lottia gigantea]ESO83761.1 hypothetical protein LOTGIDRAFT_168999 [Lottia gigantea]